MSLKDSITAECKNCSVDPEDGGTWRGQIRHCAGVTCELYPVRPLPVGVKHDKFTSRRKAINAHCKSCIYDEGDLVAKGTWRMQVRDCKSINCGLYSERPQPAPNNSIEVTEIS